jgi:hypothetical protein
VRARKELNGVTLKAYAGTTGILLAFNVTDELKDGLLGFAVRNQYRYKLKIRPSMPVCCKYQYSYGFHEVHLILTGHQMMIITETLV